MISEELLKLQATKKALKDAENKYGLGVDDATPFAEYADKVNNICELTTGLPANATFDLKDEKAQAGIWASFDFTKVKKDFNVFGKLPIKVVNLDGANFANVYDYNSYFKNNTIIENVTFNVTANSDVYLYSFFSGCSNLAFAKVGFNRKVKSVANMFSGCSNLLAVDISGLDTSLCDSFERFFSGCTKLCFIKGLDSLDTSSAISMHYMFGDWFTNSLENAKEIDVSSFNTINVKTTELMFNNCKADIKGLDNFKLDSCISMSNMLLGSNFTGWIDWTNSNIRDDCDLNAAFDNANVKLPDGYVANKCPYGWSKNSLRYICRFKIADGSTTAQLMYNYGQSKYAIRAEPLDTHSVQDFRWLFPNGTTHIYGLDVSSVNNAYNDPGFGYYENVINNYNRNLQTPIYFCKLTNLGKSQLNNLVWFKYQKHWGDAYPGDDYWPEDTDGGAANRQSLIDTLITHSYDRTANGMPPLTLALHQDVKDRLTTAELAQIAAKGITIA